MRRKERTRYVLLDLSNGDALEPRGAARIYFWEFRTLPKAQDFLKEHNKVKGHSELTGPFKVKYGTKMHGGIYYAMDRT